MVEHVIDMSHCSLCLDSGSGTEQRGAGVKGIGVR